MSYHYNQTQETGIKARQDTRGIFVATPRHAAFRTGEKELTAGKWLQDGLAASSDASCDPPMAVPIRHRACSAAIFETPKGPAALSGSSHT